MLWGVVRVSKRWSGGVVFEEGSSGACRVANVRLRRENDLVR